MCAAASVVVASASAFLRCVLCVCFFFVFSCSIFHFFVIGGSHALDSAAICQREALTGYAAALPAIDFQFILFGTHTANTPVALINKL